MCIDSYYEGSTKRKNGLKSYCIFCDQEYKSIIKHVSTRWLSLENAVERMLKLYPSLVSYFKSADYVIECKFWEEDGLCEQHLDEFFRYFGHFIFNM